MLGGIYNRVMEDNAYYKSCTKCGRPQTICKGKCCKKPRCGCDCECREYGCKHAACIREKNPTCPYEAVIPSVTTEDISGIDKLADCFVHVSNINTTFYIDDKHRIITTWAGMVEVSNYDYDANPLRLRGQMAYDSAANEAAIYDNQGNYTLIQVSSIANDYKLLNNKPSVNGVTIEGALSLEDLGIDSITNEEIDEIMEEE